MRRRVIVKITNTGIYTVGGGEREGCRATHDGNKYEVYKGVRVG